MKAHAKVVRAALDLFGERGIEATSMGAIAQASGVSKATIGGSDCAFRSACIHFPFI